MTREFSFAERLAFSKAQRHETTESTIAAMLDGCADVRSSTRDEERLGVDYVATLRGGALVLIDEKRREQGCSAHWKDGQPELALEIWSVVPEKGNKGVAGWTLSESKTTDMVLFTFDDEDCDTFYLLPFQHLRMAFRRNFTEWRDLFRVADQRTDGRYQSRCIFVPVDLVRDAIYEAFAMDEPERASRAQLSLPISGGANRS